MGEKEDKEKAEKLAAAKKRVAQLQKKKATTGDKGSSSKTKAKDIEKDDTDSTPLSPTKVATEGDTTEVGEVDPTEDVKVTDPPADERKDSVEPVNLPGSGGEAENEEEDEDTAAFNSVIQAANHGSQDIMKEEEDTVPLPTGNRLSSPGPEQSMPTSRIHPARQPSISLQSKIRSASFRHGGTPTSPGPEDSDIPDIYRRQIARIEELEKENKRLAREASEHQSRWQKTELELEELRERAVDSHTTPADDSEEIQKLRSEINTLRRSARQSLSLPNRPRDDEAETLKRDLESKDSTISDMQLEISRLRSQLSTQTSGCETHGEQITALQSSLQRAETTTTKLQTELIDTKKALTRASEKAVLDGTERTSKETKIRSLEREFEELRIGKDEAEKKADILEKKVEALNKLHREAEARNAPKIAAVDQAAKEVQILRAKIETVEKENSRLREVRKHRLSGDGADEGLDELEDEDRKKLERKIRELEGENFDLRRGVWRDKRREMQPNMSLGRGSGGDTGDGFDEVDLNGSASATRKSSNAYGHALPSQTKHSNFTQVLNSGFAAFRAATTSPDTTAQRMGRPRNDSLLEEFDDDDDNPFDENAFATAQREEEMRKMVEHVREIKKGLKQWSGWRLDLVDLRRSSSGPGFGEIFEA